MNKWYLFCFVCFAVFLTIPVQTQAQPGNKLLRQKAEFNEIPIIQLNVSQAKLSQLKNSQNDFKNKVFAFGLPVGINLLNSGIWLGDDGYSIWALGVSSPGAKSLSLILKDVEIHAGAQINVFNSQFQLVAGPFNRHQINKNGMLITPFVQGDFFYLQYTIPNKQAIGALTIESAQYDFVGIIKDGRFGLSDACHVNVNCYPGDLYKNARNAVVRLAINKITETEFCTGTLLNNQKNDETPYILTARHCINKNIHANRTIVYFNYQSEGCENTTDSEFTSEFGAELVATAPNLDFALIKLDKKLDYRHKPYYSGWDADDFLVDEGFGIHHPQGDVKKISFFSSQLNTSSYNTTGTEFDNNTFWQVEEWSTGVTESGSSGSALFNTSGQVIGTLTGGAASCSSPFSDYYQKFSESYNRYAIPGEQLAIWLDPENTGINYMQGYDPFENFEQGLELSNIDSSEMVTSIINNNWGYITGHSAGMATQFAEKFESDSAAWLIGFTINAAKVYAASDSSAISFKVWDGNNSPMNEKYSKTMLLDELSMGKNMFYLKDKVEVNTSFFLGYELYYKQPTDTFAVFHSAPNTQTKQGSAWARYYSWVPFNQYVNNAFISLDIQPVIINKPVNNDELPGKFEEPFIIYQQSPGIYKVYLNEAPINSILGSIYNSMGQQVKTFRMDVYQFVYEIDASQYRSGVYFVQLFYKNKYLTKKFILSNH